LTSAFELVTISQSLITFQKEHQNKWIPLTPGCPGECDLIKKKSVLLIIALILAPLSISGLTVDAQAQVQPVLHVAASVPSLAGIIEEVGSPWAAVSTLLDEQTDPHTFTITPSILSTANDADLLIFTGHFHWEEDLANQTSTPFITLHDAAALASYDDFGARLSPLPGGLVSDEDNGNPHAYWLLPSNAMAIANATRVALSSLNATLSNSWNENFNTFAQNMENLQALISSLDDIHGFSDMRAIVVAPAEAYVAEAFGIQCEAVLQVEDITLSGAKLLEVQAALRNGTVELILGSDVAQYQAAGSYAYQLQADYGGTLIWWQTVFYEESDYFSLMTFNLGALVSGIEGRSGGTINESMNLGLIALVIVLGIIVAIETTLLIIRAREQ
jgi:ABC-type Zn uptake system ZnuABC Zn-binding protein ZnuA